MAGERREVRYTDQEYEDDSSDCEDVLLEVPSLPGIPSSQPARNTIFMPDDNYASKRIATTEGKTGD